MEVKKICPKTPAGVVILATAIQIASN
jgi:hypothetical protein